MTLITPGVSMLMGCIAPHWNNKLSSMAHLGTLLDLLRPNPGVQLDLLFILVRKKIIYTKMLFYLNQVLTTLVDVKCLIKDLEHQLF